MVVVRARLTPKVGAVVLHALEAALEQVPPTADGNDVSIAPRRANALGMVAESALAGELDPGGAGDRFQVTMRVEAETLCSREAGIAAPRGWVALGGCPPRAPTDPDVRNSRIRLLGVEDSLLSVQSVHDSGWCKRVPGQEPSKRLPGPVSGMGASSQPFPPQAFHLASIATQ